jgi:hypothetical protein
MSDDRSFLARWSARKQNAALEFPEGKPANAADASRSARPNEPAQADQGTPFDPASLPPLDSISAVSDVRAFLASGVPADLTRAALRRAWTADPSIRDFIGLSENSWDFNARDGVLGFGALDAKDIEKLLAQAVGRTEEEEAPADHAVTVGQATVRLDEHPAPTASTEPLPQCNTPSQPSPTSLPDTAVGGSESCPSESVPHAAPEKPPLERDRAGEPDACAAGIRRHGGALPKS